MYSQSVQTHSFCSLFSSQRKETLLKEYKLRNKSGKFIDRRFGEYDTKMAPEDKILQRFAMERKVSDVNIIPPHVARKHTRESQQFFRSDLNVTSCFSPRGPTIRRTCST